MTAAVVFNSPQKNLAMDHLHLCVLHVQFTRGQSVRQHLVVFCYSGKQCFTWLSVRPQLDVVRQLPALLYARSLRRSADRFD